MRAVRRALLLIVVLSSILVMVATGPASAHTAFESSDPADGTTVEGAVDEVTIAFSGVAEPAGEGFVVLDPSGTIRTPDAVTSDAERQRWTLGFDPALADGVVGIRWTVRAPDAHPISGSLSFTVTTTASTDAETAPEPEQPSATTSTPAEGTDDPGESLDLESTETGPGTEAAAGLPDDDSSAEAPDLDAFLAQADPSIPYAEGVGAFGRLLGFVGTMLGIGGLCFAAVVVRDHRRDLRSVLKAVRYAAAVVVVGTAIDLVTHLAVARNAWGEAMAADTIRSVARSAVGLALGLRMAAGVLLFAAAKVTHRQIDPVERLAAERELVPIGGDRSPIHVGRARETEPGGADDGPPVDRRPISTGSVVAVIVLLASFTFDGHTVTEGNRFVTGAVDMIHVIAASIWAGGVVAFAVVLWRRHRRRERLNGLDMALRFSVIAGASLAVAGIAGTILAAIILDSVSELWTTTWGRLLVAKTAAVVAAASLGSYNHFVVIPWLKAHPGDDARSVRIRNTATGEAVLLAVVIAVTAFLVGASSQP